jgi:hypothetical protein
MADNLHMFWCVDSFLVHADLICVRLLSRLVFVVLVGSPGLDVRRCGSGVGLLSICGSSFRRRVRLVLGAPERRLWVVGTAAPLRRALLCGCWSVLSAVRMEGCLHGRRAWSEGRQCGFSDLDLGGICAKV